MTTVRTEILFPKVGREEICRTVLEALPDWFGIEEARDSYSAFAATAPMAIAKVDREIAGYVALACHFKRNCEVHSMGVLPHWHRHGIGAALVKAVADWALSRGFSFLSVKTLSENHPDPNYASTRAFYRALGFQAFEEFNELWGASLPCLVMVRQLK